mmetsp:Transcript_20120/g.36703  ORF Transcript_20120/g.36703 Transcript_20120/m.36703 type:complete len:85 (+) Transcript_20120:898-1152(+)
MNENLNSYSTRADPILPTTPSNRLAERLPKSNDEFDITASSRSIYIYVLLTFSMPPPPAQSAVVVGVVDTTIPMPSPPFRPLTS